MQNTALFLICLSTIGIAQNSPGYHLVKKIAVGGEGGWDYITFDAQSHRLFASHGTKVVVISTDSDKVVGEIPKTEGVHGIAVADEFGRCFVSNGRASTVSIVDLKTLKLIDTISVGKNPDAILYEPFTKTIITWNGRSSNATVIDAKTDKIIQIIALAGKPEAAVSDGKGKVFVNIEDKSEVCMINVKTWKVEQTWSISPGEEPSGLALDVDNHRLFSATDKLMVILDSETGKVITTVVTGGRVDGAGFDPGLKRAYSSCGEGVLTVVQEENPNSFKVLENVPTQAGARTISVSAVTHRIYLPTAEFGPTPEKTADNPRPRPALKPGTFTVLVVEPVK